MTAEPTLADLNKAEKEYGKENQSCDIGKLSGDKPGKPLLQHMVVEDQDQNGRDKNGMSQGNPRSL